MHTQKQAHVLRYNVFAWSMWHAMFLQGAFLCEMQRFCEIVTERFCTDTKKHQPTCFWFGKLFVWNNSPGSNFILHNRPDTSILSKGLKIFTRPNHILALQSRQHLHQLQSGGFSIKIREIFTVTLNGQSNFLLKYTSGGKIELYWEHFKGHQGND